MQAGSVLSSVAILFHEFNSLDTAVRLSVDYIQQLVEQYDRTAEILLQDIADDPERHDAVSKVIDLFRMVNTGNLEWRYVLPVISFTSCLLILTRGSLGAKRYGVTEFMQEDGSIELYL